MFSRLDLIIKAAPGIGLIAALPWWLPATLFLAGATHYAWLAFPAIACLIASGMAYRQKGLLHGSQTLRRIEVRGDSLRVVTNTGSRREAGISPESRIAHRWLWLKLDDGDTNHTLLLSDRAGFRNTDPIPLRRLTVWLRYRQPGPGAQLRDRPNDEVEHAARVSHHDGTGQTAGHLHGRHREPSGL